MLRLQSSPFEYNLGQKSKVTPQNQVNKQVENCNQKKKKC